MKTTTIVLATIMGVLILVFVMAGIAIGVASASDYVRCRDLGQQSGLATEYSITGGCSTTILGTKVRLF